MSRVKRIFPELPDVTPVAGTKILVTDADNFAFGYADVSTLQVTLDGTGLASDAALSAVSGAIATKLNNTAFNYITGSNGGWNDASASAAGIPVGGLYHSVGTVKVRLA